MEKEEAGAFLPTTESTRQKNSDTSVTNKSKGISCQRPSRKWAILVSAFVCHMVVTAPFAFGVLYHELLVYYQESRQLTAVVISLTIGLTFGPGIIVSPFVVRFGPRIAIMVGSVSALLASIISFFATGITYLICSFGILFGLGNCLINIGSKVAIGQHFDKKNDIAFSIVYMGGSIGGILIIQLQSLLTPRYGIHGCILLTGAILFHACAAGALITPVKCKVPLSKMDEDSGKMGDTKCNSKCFDLLKRPIFLVWLLMVLICTSSFIIVFVTLVDYVVSIGYTETSGVLMMTLLEFVGIPTRLIYGIVSARTSTFKMHLSIVVFTIGGVMLVLFAEIQSEIGLYVIAILFGCAANCATTSLGIVTEHLSEGSNREHAFGLMATTMGIGFSVSGPFIGWVTEVTGSYSWSYLVNGSMCLSASLFTLAVVLAIGARSKKFQHPKDETGLESEIQ